MNIPDSSPTKVSVTVQSVEVQTVAVQTTKVKRPRCKICRKRRFQLHGTKETLLVWDRLGDIEPDITRLIPEPPPAHIADPGSPTTSSVLEIMNDIADEEII